MMYFERGKIRKFCAGKLTPSFVQLYHKRQFI